MTRALRAALLFCVAAACHGCGLLELFEEHEPRTPAQHGTLRLHGRIEGPFEISAAWRYYTTPDTRSCRGSYDFAAGYWVGHRRRFHSPASKADADGRYQLTLELEVPHEHTRCQWNLGGPKIYIRPTKRADATWFEVGNAAGETTAPATLNLRCYVTGLLNATCPPDSDSSLWALFKLPKLDGRRTQLELNVKLIPDPEPRYGENGFEGLAALLDAGAESTADASAPR